MKFRHPGCIIAPIAVLLCLLILDAFLYRIDPSGLYRYYSDLNDLFANSLPAEDGYRLAPGTYYFRTFRVTIGLDGLRVVAGTKRASCRIAFVGDSVTFGFGSDTTFVDILASDLPARVINAGLTGYSAANVLLELDSIPAEGYVWIIVGNDDETFSGWHIPSSASPLPPAIAMYLGNLYVEPPEHDVRRFQRSADIILARDDVLAFMFETNHNDPVQVFVHANYPQVRFIPEYTYRVSAADSHPDETGHAEIAAAMHDDVMAFAQQRCQR